jgi:hypothetical protein
METAWDNAQRQSRNYSMNFHTFMIIKIVPWIKNIFYVTSSNPGSRDGNWLRAAWPRGWNSSPGRVKNFLCHVIQTSSGAHPASYTMGTGASFFGGKAAGAWS